MAQRATIGRTLIRKAQSRLNIVHQAIDRSKRLYAQRGVLVFILVFTFASEVTAFVMGGVCSLLSLPVRTDLDEMSTGALVFVAVIFAPLTETLLAQTLPVAVARRFFRASDFYCWLAAALAFALLHAGIGLATVLSAGIGGGVFFGLAYVSLVDQGKLRAFTIVSAIHALHNLILVLLTLAFRT